MVLPRDPHHFHLQYCNRQLLCVENFNDNFSLYGHYAYNFCNINHDIVLSNDPRRGCCSHTLRRNLFVDYPFSLVHCIKCGCFSVLVYCLLWCDLLFSLAFWMTFFGCGCIVEIPPNSYFCDPLPCHVFCCHENVSEIWK